MRNGDVALNAAKAATATGVVHALPGGAVTVIQDAGGKTRLAFGAGGCVALGKSRERHADACDEKHKAKAEKARSDHVDNSPSEYEKAQARPSSTILPQSTLRTKTKLLFYNAVYIRRACRSHKKGPVKAPMSVYRLAPHIIVRPRRPSSRCRSAWYAATRHCD